MYTSKKNKKHGNTMVYMVISMVLVRKMCTANPSWEQVQDTNKNLKHHMSDTDVCDLE